jgi:hypothetical protein
MIRQELKGLPSEVAKRMTFEECWGPSSSEGPQKHDLTMFSK